MSNRKASAAYLEKLRDPRWQKMRLEIMQRDEFTCQNCRDTSTTLNVHHRRYRRGADPWDYDLRDLVTLCEFCHESETAIRAEREADLLEMMRRKLLGDDIAALEILLQYLPEGVRPMEIFEAVEHYLRDNSRVKQLLDWDEEFRSR
jgi:hypothetical protein